MKSLWKTSCLFNLFDVQYEMWKKWHIGECVIGPEIHDFVYICKGYIYEYKEASASNGRCLFYMCAHMTKPPDKQGACSMFMRLIIDYYILAMRP